MNFNVTFGYPELLLVCGVTSIFHSHNALGITLCVLSAISAMTRMGIEANKLQQEELRKQQLLSEIQNAGEEFAETLVELFNKDKSKKTVH